MLFRYLVGAVKFFLFADDTNINGLSFGIQISNCGKDKVSQGLEVIYKKSKTLKTTQVKTISKSASSIPSFVDNRKTRKLVCKKLGTNLGSKFMFR